MDILKEFKAFFCNGGIDQHIYRFRHPGEIEQSIFSVRYIPETDSREYQYEEGDKEYNPFTDGLQTLSLANSFKKLFSLYVRSLNEACEKLEILSHDNQSFIKEAFESPEPDFNAIRTEIRTNVAYGSFADIALQHVIDVEAIYRKCKFDCKVSAMALNSKKKAPEDGVICFEYRGDKQFLSKVYCNLNLESGDFINKNKTSEQEFITILTSAHVQSEAGRIFFECETRQAAYIIKQLTNYFDNLTPSQIGRSQKFYSGNEKPVMITANSLSKNWSDNKHKPEIKEKKAIDNFFKSYSTKV